MEEKKFTAKDEVEYWLVHNLIWWFDIVRWLLRWWGKYNFSNNILIILGAGSVLWYYTQINNPWLWFGIFLGNVFISAFAYYLQDSWKAFSWLWFPLLFSVGAQFALFLIVIKSILEFIIQIR